MKNRNKHLMSNIGILALSSFSSKILSFFLVPLYTSVLSTEEYGVYDLFIVAAELLVPILSINIYDALMRFLLDSKKDKSDIIVVGVKYTSIAMILSTLIIYLSNKIGFFKHYNNLLGMIWIYIIAYIIYQYCFQYAKGMDKVKELGIAGVLSTVLNISGNLVFLLLLNMRLDGFLLANVVSLSVSTLYLFLSLKIWKCFRIKKVNRAIECEMLRYCVPLIFTTISWWANSSLDKIIVSLICGVSANGLISIAYKIPGIVTMAQTVFIQAWQISAIKEYDSDVKNKFYEDVYILFNFVLCGIGFGLIFFTKFLARIMFSNEFYNAWEYVPFLVIAVIINSASGFLGAILSAEKKAKVMAASAIVGLLSNVVLNLILVYFLGIQGATIATAVSSYFIYLVREKYSVKFMSNTRYAQILVQWILLSAHAVIKVFELPILVEIIIGGILLLMNISLIRTIIKKVKRIMNK